MASKESILVFIILLHSALMASKNPPKSWTQQDLANAVEAIGKKELSIRKAGQAYGVPKSTLFDYLKDNTDVEKRLGPETVLTSDEESVLVWNAKCDKNRVNLCAGHERKCVLVNVNAFTGTFMRT